MGVISGIGGVGVATSGMGGVLGSLGVVGICVERLGVSAGADVVDIGLGISSDGVGDEVEGELDGVLAMGSVAVGVLVDGVFVDGALVV